MINAKAKDVNDWKIWHYGTLESADTLNSGENLVKVEARSVCEDTGLKCKGRSVYENDWLELEGNGETHRFLVVRGENGFSAAEDENLRYNLQEVVSDETCRIVGNIYD